MIYEPEKSKQFFKGNIYIVKLDNYYVANVVHQNYIQIERDFLNVR